MRKTLLSLSLASAMVTSAAAQIVPPAPGVEIPPGVIQSMDEKGANAFQFKHAWLEKTRRIKEARERFIQERGFYDQSLMAQSMREQLSVTGTFSVPVFCVKYSDTGADPFPISSLQTKLFDGPFAPQTVSQFYDEISYGDLTLTGTVYGWTLLPNNNLYYTGAGTCDGLCGTAHIPQLINSTLAANDAAVNFGIYDNDGPDGLPNSGDDDGYVDFVSFVQPEQGAECGVHGNIWSHRFSLTGWGAIPYTTNDARTGGGFILVDDYTIQPVYNCGGVTLIDIGVFAHEWGHAFGLPDLYDTDGGSQGVGHWCLMGSGNWNSPTLPAHMSGWSKNFLGWSNIVVVDGVPTNYNVDNVENNRTVYRLDVAHELWRRMTDCAIAGSYSMRCGLLASEAAGRNWASGSGYGNQWDTTVSRDFFYNGSGSVSLSYQYSYDVEPSYDFVYGEVISGGNTSTFALYNTTGSGTENVDLTPYLAGSQPYTVKFRFTSDQSWSDEDGLYATACGSFVFDNVSVVGGGENYSTDFEAREDGWAPVLPSEYFLVENRQPLGSDTNVWGDGGIAIWHVDPADQTGGPSNNRPRGVALEQADGLGNLEANVNRGDAGDPYPGSTNNMLFDGTTTPDSDGHDGPSQAMVQLLGGNGDPIPVSMRGGWPAPTYGSITPNIGTSGNLVPVQIDGAGFAKVGDAELVLGPTTLPSTSVEWVGKDRILVTFDLTGALNGFYDLVLYNPGGANSVAVGVFEVEGGSTGVGDNPSVFALRANYPNPFNPSTTIRYEIPSHSHVTLQVFDVSGALVRTLVDETKAAGAYTVEWNGRNNHGDPASSGVYFYRLTAPGFSDVRKMTLIK